MLWIARYIKLNSNQEVLINRVGLIWAGNCREVVGKVCRLANLHLPTDYKNETTFHFRTAVPDFPIDFEIHEIIIGPIDTLIDLDLDVTSVLTSVD